MHTHIHTLQVPLRILYGPVCPVFWSLLGPQIVRSVSMNKASVLCWCIDSLSACHSLQTEPKNASRRTECQCKRCQTLIITVNVWNQKTVSSWLQLNDQDCWIQWNTAALLQKSKRVSQQINAFEKYFVLEIHCQSKSVVLDENWRAHWK